MPMTIPIAPSSQIALPEFAPNSAAHPAICTRPPTTSLPRIASRRPVTAETASALSDRGSSTSPAVAADRSRPSSSHCVKPYRNAYAVVKLRN